MIYGWKGKRLVVDLSAGVIQEEEIEGGLLEDYLGGRGLNVHTLTFGQEPGIDPYAPEALLCFGTGPLTGTNVAANGRYNATAKSPATGILGDANSGGFWAPELKYAGYDQVVITGCSEIPVYLVIRDGRAEIKDARHLWGRDVWETEATIKAELGDENIQIASIGQAGENRVRFAGIINNLARAAGRTGMGAVMGSKKLKAIAVRGTRGLDVARPDLLEGLNKELLQAIYQSPSYPIRSTLGTSMLVELYNGMGVLPTRNSRDSVFEGAQDISGRTLVKRYVRKSKGCFACPVHCGHFYEVMDGPYAGTRGEGPEFETVCSFGARVGNRDLAAILEANNRCNKYGLDTLSTGSVIAFIMECYEAGLIKYSDLNGLDLSWGNPETILTLITKIARREGIGQLLAEGVERIVPQIPGSEQFAQTIKGLEVPTQDVRGLKAWALGWATSSRGADHCRAFPLAESTWSPEEAEQVFGTKDAANRLVTSGKAEMVAWYEQVNAVGDSLELCRIAQLGCNMPLPLIAQILSAVTGVDFTEERLLTIGERIITLERVYNLREGLTPADDRLPQRFVKEPARSGPSAGEVVELEGMLNRYYELRQWDRETGWPKEEVLKKFGLEALAP